jgi:hypothetical protein
LIEFEFRKITFFEPGILLNLTEIKIRQKNK